MAALLLESAFQEANTRTLGYVATLAEVTPIGASDIDTSKLPGFTRKYVGKVRDTYECEDCMVLVTTDRQSAFDRPLTEVPCKGQVLNLTSLWWFKSTQDFVPNHVLASPHPNVTIGRKCSVFPIEFVMRGYITGSTSTSLWTNYNKGVRDYCGHVFADGLVKNQQLDSNKLTPTTKSDVHDELISAAQVVAQGHMTQADWDACAAYAHALFEFGQKEAAGRGLILVDTKYEFGRCSSTGQILLIDEIQTPDSSRYWMSSTYAAQFAAGNEPDNIDKEFLRKWYIAQCDPYAAAALPAAPKELVVELARRYVLLFELITGEPFAVPSDAAETVSDAVVKYFADRKK